MGRGCLPEGYTAPGEDAGRVACIVIGSAIAAYRAAGCAETGIVCCRAGIASQPRILRVVEDVKSFGPELEISGFSNGEMLQHCHIEVRSDRVVENISSRISEGQTLGRNKY